MNKPIIAVFSSKGGCGKSTSVEAIASCLEGSPDLIYGNKRVLCIDCDSIGSRGLSNLVKYKGPEFGKRMLSHVCFANFSSNYRYYLDINEQTGKISVATTQARDIKSSKGLRDVWDCIVRTSTFDIIPAGFNSFLNDLSHIDLLDFFREFDTYELACEYIDKLFRVSKQSIDILRAHLEYLLKGDDTHDGYDMILLDMPPLTCNDSLLFLGASDYCIMPIGVGIASQNAIISVLRAFDVVQEQYDSKVQFLGSFFTMVRNVKQDNESVEVFRDFFYDGLVKHPLWKVYDTVIPFDATDIMKFETNYTTRNRSVFKMMAGKKYATARQKGKINLAYTSLTNEIMQQIF